MHLDEEAARATLVGGLCASGWHTCAIMMRMVADGFLLNSSSMGAPGVEEIRWLAPVRPGDELRVRGHSSRQEGIPKPAASRFCQHVLRSAQRRRHLCHDLAHQHDVRAQNPGYRRCHGMNYFEDLRLGERESSAATRSPPRTSRHSRSATIRRLSMSMRKRRRARISARCVRRAGTPVRSACG